jgi:excinuclease ABC subunit C
MPRVQKNRSNSPPAPEDPGAAAPPVDPGAGLNLAAAPASVRHGAATIRGFWEHAPAGPGVYRMIAANGEVLYVGKAKSVRKRIASYMRPSGHTTRIARMIALTASSSRSGPRPRRFFSRRISSSR